MAGSGNVRLRIGVVGLGRLWEARHKPALARLRERFAVTAVFDQVPRRAEIEAEQLNCKPSAGLVDLIENDEVDAVYLLSPQWFGFHALELAAKARKAIYCALPISGSEQTLSQLDACLTQSGAPFMPEFARRFYPTTIRLRELLSTTLGPPRLVIAQGRLFGFDRYGQPGPSTQMAPTSLLVDPGAYLLDWCRFVFQGEPVSVQGWKGTILPSSERSETDFIGYVLHFEPGAVAQVSAAKFHRSAWGDASRFLPQPGIQVYAERGVASLEMPDRIHWTDASGIHEERLPQEPSVGELLNEHFYRLVTGAASMAPTWDDALSVARLVQSIQRSTDEARTIETMRLA